MVPVKDREGESAGQARYLSIVARQLIPLCRCVVIATTMSREIGGGLEQEQPGSQGLGNTGCKKRSMMS